MLEVCGIIMLSCSYSGIFKGTDMLADVQGKINQMMSRTGRFLMMLIMGFMTSIVFCSQTIAIMLCSDLMTKPYLQTGGNRTELATDIENRHGSDLCHDSVEHRLHGTSGNDGCRE